MSCRYDSSDDTTSISCTDTSWLDTSSDSNNDGQGCSEPEQKKRRKGHSVEKNFVETEISNDFVLKANYKWVIKEFNKLFNKSKIGDKIESPTFTTGFKDEFKWRLQLYPKGYSVQNTYFLSVYLYLVSSKESRLRVHYKCSIINHRKKLTYETHGEEYFSQGQRYGFKRFRCVNDLFLNDGFILACDIDAQLSKAFLNKIKLINDLELLLNSGNYSDVTIEVENKSFKVHKYILAARSPVFAAMFKYDMTENQQNVIKIPDISHAIMNEILRFTYTGEVESIDTTAMDLLAAANKYAFEDLKIMCENALIKSLSVENSIDILNFAELHNAVKLKDHALSFIVHNVHKVVKTESFKIMGDTQSPLLAQMIAMMASQQSKNYCSQK